MAYEQWIEQGHKCRTDDCGHPMPLPESQGKACPECGTTQPTYNQLMSRTSQEEVERAAKQRCSCSQ